LNGCPSCGGAVDGVVDRERFIEEIPVIQPRVTRLVTHHGRCRDCGKDVASSHPMRMSTAGGAAKVQLGLNTLAWAATLNKQFGLTMRKTSRVLQRLTGLKLSPGGLAQAVQRIAAKVESGY